jgi:hypothetical protein
MLRRLQGNSQNYATSVFQQKNLLPICCALKKRCGTLLLHETLRAGQTWLAPLLSTAFRHDMKNLINIIIRESNYPAV